MNWLGEYDDIQSVWKDHPEGGKEGDYVTVAKKELRWNKYLRIWGDSKEPSTYPSRETYVHEGDVIINHDLTVGGTIRAKGVRQPNKGLFYTVEALKKKYPDPEVGWWAVVGNVVPGPIYRCDTPGEWTPTGEIGGVDKFDYDTYPLSIDFDTNGDNYLQYGDFMTLKCRVMRGWYKDITDSVIKWTIVRDSGDRLEDEAWLLKDKVKNFNGVIDICWTATENDLGNSANRGAVFTVVAIINDEKVKGILEI